MELRPPEALNPERIRGERPWPVYREEVKSRGAAVEGAWRPPEAEAWSSPGSGSKRLQLSPHFVGVWIFLLGNWE